MQVNNSAEALSTDNKVLGAGIGILGFVVLVLAALLVLGTVAASAAVTDSVVILGLALLVVGFGVFGYGWAGGMPQQALSANEKWSLILTLVSTALIAFVVLWANAVGDVIWTVVSVGALGGLVHEIAQSKGTAFIPGKASSTPGGANTGEDYLGGLVGIILGGAAGLLTLAVSSGTSTPSKVSVQLIVTAFSAGIALKGISDAAASPPKTGT
jgi:hypothetical protein